MKNIIEKILHKELNEQILSITEINGLGSVNKVFSIKGNKSDYIIRLNEDPQKKIEYRKEKWCIENVIKLGIPSPKVLSIGFQNKISFMILNKLQGINGINCNSETKENIWINLGKYARKYQQVKQIEDKKVRNSEFHKNWKARLEYNLDHLTDEDSLIKKHIFNQVELKNAKKALSSLINIDFKVGLVHGDLCPRNIIWDEDIVYLLDWGTAEINVVPHNEIGILMMSNEANEREFDLFIEGLGLSLTDYQKMKIDIHILNFLHWLDKYRWAEDYQADNISEFEEKVRDTFNKI